MTAIEQLANIKQLESDWGIMLVEQGFRPAFETWIAGDGQRFRVLCFRNPLKPSLMWRITFCSGGKGIQWVKYFNQVRWAEGMETFGLEDALIGQASRQ
jgi:hypothetical protein